MNVKEVLEYFSDPTIFEQEKNIKVKSHWMILEDQTDIKFYCREKEDQSLSLLIIYHTGKGVDNWLGWMISKNQAETLTGVLPELYRVIDEYNNYHQEPKP